MSEITLTKIRRHILEACDGHNGAPEGKWHRQALEEKAIAFMLEQQMLDRRFGDGKSAFEYRLHITERGRAALRGDILTKLDPPKKERAPRTPIVNNSG